MPDGFMSGEHATAEGRNLSAAVAGFIASHGKEELLKALTDHWHAVADSMGGDMPWQVRVAKEITADGLPQHEFRRGG